VIASRACGVEGLPGVRTVAAGDVDGLRAALDELAAGVGGSAGDRRVLDTPPAESSPSAPERPKPHVPGLARRLLFMPA
jgi:hypothetical protein